MCTDHCLRTFCAVFFTISEYTIRMNEGLHKYINDARERHMDDSVIRANLIQAGWSQKTVSEALPETLETPKPTVSLGKELFLYVFSAILPPFGLVWAFKYLRAKTQQGKRIGTVIIIVTIVSLVINIWLLLVLYNQYFELLNSISDIGY